MLPKPPNWGPRYGASFSEPAVADAYPHRPPYPDEVFDVLAGLAVDEPGAVLDLGCGTGSWRPSVDTNLTCRHSQQSFSLERMGQAQAQAFDAAIRTVLDDLVRQAELTLRDDRLDLGVEPQVVWGTPRHPYA